MTVNAGARGADFAANGVTTSWPLNFQYLSSDDLVVTLIDADDVETVLSEGVGYTLSGSGPAGTGTLHRTPADATGNAIEVRRVTVLEQTTDFVANDNLPAEALEGVLDRLVLAMQEVADDVSDASGPQGDDGADGKTVLSGSGAPSGGLGTNGDFYLDTAASRLYGPKTAGAWGSGTSLIGSTGATGNTVLSGSGAPAGGTGANGDYYINNSGGYVIYGPKSAGAWGSGTSLVGPAGSGAGDMLKSELLSGLSNYSMARSNMGLAIGTNVQAFSSVLSTYAGIAPSANVQTLLGAASFAGFRVSAGLAIGSDVQAFSSVLSTYAGIAPSANVQTLLGAANFAAFRTSLALGTVAVMDAATAAHFRANTADKALVTDDVWSAAAGVTLTDAATVLVDFSAGFNFSLTLAGNRTLGNPSNSKVGQTGVIEILQDGSGSRTLGYASNWKFLGGSAPVLSTAASARDVLTYVVLPSGVIWAALGKAVG